MSVTNGYNTKDSLGLVILYSVSFREASTTQQI